jgi:hypothetical protein
MDSMALGKNPQLLDHKHLRTSDLIDVSFPRALEHSHITALSIRFNEIDSFDFPTPLSLRHLALAYNQVRLTFVF